MRTFGASRITVGRAVRDLQAQGLVERRAGSGTYVASTSAPGALSFGLLIPDLGETDIFEPVCQGMMASPLARNHALIWGSLGSDGGSKEDRAWQLCRQYIERRVSGVFFAPLEFTAPRTTSISGLRRRSTTRASRSCCSTARSRRIRGAVTTIWSGSTTAARVSSSPSTSFGLGSQRVAFVAQPNAAATVDAREAGYREALYAVSRARRSRAHPPPRPVRRRTLFAS